MLLRRAHEKAGLLLLPLLQFARLACVARLACERGEGSPTMLHPARYCQSNSVHMYPSHAAVCMMVREHSSAQHAQQVSTGFPLQHRIRNTPGHNAADLVSTWLVGLCLCVRLSKAEALEVGIEQHVARALVHAAAHAPQAESARLLEQLWGSAGLPPPMRKHILHALVTCSAPEVQPCRHLLTSRSTVLVMNSV